MAFHFPHNLQLNSDTCHSGTEHEPVTGRSDPVIDTPSLQWRICNLFQTLVQGERMQMYRKEKCHTEAAGQSVRIAHPLFLS